jgi:hypothetical protein
MTITHSQAVDEYPANQRLCDRYNTSRHGDGSCDIHHDSMRPEWADLNITANSSKRTTSNVLRSSNGQRWLADLTHVRHHHSGRDALGVDTRTSILTVQRLGKEVSECLGSCGLTTARRKLAMPHAFCRHRRQQLA